MMIKLILAIVLIPSICFAEITYEKLSQRQENWGIDVTVRFADSETDSQRTTTFRFDDQAQIDSEYVGRMSKKITNIQYDLNPLNAMRLEGVEMRPLIKKLVQYIRNNPDCTVSQITTAIDTNYPNLNWKPDKLINYIKDYLNEIMGKTFTFAQFKTYVINHKFADVD